MVWVAAAIAALAFGVILLFRRRVARLPPSPPGESILGHLRCIPSQNPEVQYMKWAEKYGDVLRLKILNRSIIVLNSVEAAIDLLEKRSAKYSDRPHFPIFHLMGWKDSMTFLPYGRQFQRQRQLYQEYLNRTKVNGYSELQVAHARRLALSLAKGLEEREHILQDYASAIVLRIAVGHDIFHESSQEFNVLVRETAHSMTCCGPPGGTLVDLFPILQYFPSWFPGTFYASRARECRAMVQRFYDYPFEKVQQQMSNGVAKQSFLAFHLDRLQETSSATAGHEIDDIKGSAATMIAAGAITTWSTLSVFILAMVLHPECQEQAQKELDDHVARSRLPTFEDRPSLPYIDLIVQEIYRWLPVTPLGVPHYTTEDDVYKDMFIPRGTTILANAWGMSRNEQIYQDASLFNPMRYKKKSEGGNDEPLPTFPFGFGRRICPGRNLADTSIWIAVCTILALFKIEKARDLNGNEQSPQVGTNTGLTSHPIPYNCLISIRDHYAQTLLTTIKEDLDTRSGISG